MLDMMLNKIIIALILLCFAIIIEGKNESAILNKTYTGDVGGGNENTYYFNLTGQLELHRTVRIRSCSSEARPESPMFFVVRKMDSVVSWGVPYFSGKKKYGSYTQTICRSNSNGKSSDDNFFLDVSTLYPSDVQYALRVEAEADFFLDNGIPTVVNANPTQLSFLTYTFLPTDERVLVKATSENTVCAVLVVQEVKQCTSLSANRFLGPFATMTTKAGIVVERKKMEKIYILFMVKESDDDCEQRNGKINPFKPHEFDDNLEKINFRKNLDAKAPCNFNNNGKRKKTVTITVESMPRIEEYTTAVVAPLGVFGLFYVITLLTIGIQWCLMENPGRSFYTYLFPKKVKKEEDTQNNEGADEINNEGDQCDDGGGREGQRLLTPGQMQISNNLPSYSSMEPHLVKDEEDNERVDTPVESRNEYDFLDDINHDKDVYRLNLKLFVSHTSKKSYKKQEKKYNTYYWNVLTVAVFYALPVVQLVLTYQRVTNVSGDQDICYYNFFCQRPYHIISSFNNVYSNVGYMLLGILFIFFVIRSVTITTDPLFEIQNKVRTRNHYIANRDRLSYQKHVKNPEVARTFGLPKHYGIFYAMGWALFMEGVMSACYHVCPNYSNFQFDTAFMYILGILCSLRLYQGRHHDIFINGHFAFAGFAVVIFTSVIGVIYRSKTFWIIFCFVHILTCLYLSFQLYYVGRVKTAMLLAWKSKGYNIFSKPLYPVRFILISIFNITNWSVSIYGAVNVPKDFATYLLGIIIVNGLIYVTFYSFMKIFNKEKIKMLPTIFAILSILTWGVALRYFVAGLTDWQTSAAQSREGNQECIILNFYDDHDLWHFLSAAALFFSFMCVLTIDDDLDDKERSKIVVF